MSTGMSSHFNFPNMCFVPYYFSINVLTKRALFCLDTRPYVEQFRSFADNGMPPTHHDTWTIIRRNTTSHVGSSVSTFVHLRIHLRSHVIRKKRKKKFWQRHISRFYLSRSNCGSFFSSRHLRDDDKTRLLQNNILLFEFLVNRPQFLYIYIYIFEFHRLIKILRATEAVVFY